MADNKQWFKVWTSILTDPCLAFLHNQTVGCWTRLCALTAQHGIDGKLTIPQQQLLVTLHLSNATQEEINRVINELKTLNILISEEVQKDTVTNVTLQIVNWGKYQAYSESYERVNKFRKIQKERYTCNVEKKRREEKRREENKDNQYKYKDKDKKYIYGEFKNVLLTNEELKKLKDTFGDIKTEKWIKTLDEGIENKGYKYNSHYLTILKWDRNEKERKGDNYDRQRDSGIRPNVTGEKEANNTKSDKYDGFGTVINLDE